MKKHLSVLGLFARSSVYKVLGILALMSVTEFILFILKYTGEMSNELMGRFEAYISISHTDLCFAVAFILITLILCLPGTEYSSKSGYTLNRLSVTEKAVFLYQALFNFIAYILLWAVQLMVIWGLSLYYDNTVPPEFTSSQSTFLAFYRNSFLHSLLPLEDVFLWIRNIILALALAFVAAEFPYKQRRKQIPILIFALVVYLIFFFGCKIGDITNYIISIVISVTFIYIALVTVLHKEVSYDS